MASAPVARAASARVIRSPEYVKSETAKNRAFGPGNFMPKVSSGPTNRPESDLRHPVFEGGYRGGARTRTPNAGTGAKGINPKVQRV
jgi:hypothetical protein